MENDDFLIDLHKTAEILQEKMYQESDISTPTPSPTNAEVPDMYGYPSPPIMNMMETDAPQQFRIKNENPNSSPHSLYFESLSPQDGSFFKNETLKSVPKDYCVPSPNDEVPNGSPHSFYYDISPPRNGAFYKNEVPNLCLKEDTPNGSPNSLCYDYETISVQDGTFFKSEIINSRDYNVPSPQLTHYSETPSGSPHSLCYETLSPQDGSFFKTEIVNQLSNDCSVSSPQFAANDETPSGSPNSLYYESLSPQDGSFFKSEMAKPRMKDECLVSLLSAPAKPMTNTITDTIISQLGHANSDNAKGGSNRVRTFNNTAIKTEVVDTQYVDIKQEKNFQPEIPFDMASSSACQLPSDICAIAFQNVCAEIQATCRKLQISEGKLLSKFHHVFVALHWYHV